MSSYSDAMSDFIASQKKAITPKLTKVFVEFYGGESDFIKYYKEAVEGDKNQDSSRFAHSTYAVELFNEYRDEFLDAISLLAIDRRYESGIHLIVRSKWGKYGDYWGFNSDDVAKALWANKSSADASSDARIEVISRVVQVCGIEVCNNYTAYLKAKEWELVEIQAKAAGEAIGRLLDSYN